MNYTFTEQEVEMMYYWGQYADGESGFTEEEQKILISGKPGLTGYWQVYGRGEAEYDTGERQKLELEYFYRRGLFFDLKLLFLTVPAVLKHKGAK